MLLVDTVKGELIDNENLKDSYVKNQPYGEWLSDNLVSKRLKDCQCCSQGLRL